MGAAIALIALAAASSFDASSDVGRVFRDVCTYGEGRFTGAVATEVQPNRIVPALRDNRGWSVDQAYRLRLASGDAFLLIGDTRRADDPRNTRTCVVATRAISFPQAVVALAPGASTSQDGGGQFAMATSFERAEPEGFIVGAYRLPDDWVAMTSVKPGEGTREAKRAAQASEKPAEKSDAVYKLRD